MWETLFFIVFIAVECIFKGTPEEIIEFFNKELNETVLRENEISTIAISVIINKNQPVWVGYGYQNPFVYPPLNVSRDTVFSIASISKTFCGISFLKTLGLDNLNTTVNEILPKDIQIGTEIIGDYNSKIGYPKVKADDDVRFRDVVTHSEGFDEIPWNRPKLETLHEKCEWNVPNRVRQTGVVGMYSNNAITLLGLSVQQYSGVDYGEYLRKYIFDVLEMNHTHFGYLDAKTDPNFCKMAYRTKDGRFLMYPDAEKIHEGIRNSPEGGIYTTHKAMQKYMIDILDQGKKLGLTSEEFKELFSEHFRVGQYLPPINIIFYDRDMYGERWKLHDGDISPFGSRLSFNFDNDLAVFLTMSSTHSEFNDDIRQTLMKKFTLRFLKPKGWCESVNGTIDPDNGNCVLSLDLASNWPRPHTIDYASLFHNHLGCYRETRTPHTSWLKLPFFLREEPFCVGLHDKKYLKVDGEKEIRLILEIDSNWALTDFIYGKLSEDGKSVEVMASNTSQQNLVFVPGTPEKKYWVTEVVFDSFEYVSSDYRSYYSYYYWIWFVFCAIPVFAALVLLCACCACSGINICCLCKVCKKKGKDGYEQMTDSYSVNLDSDEGKKCSFCCWSITRFFLFCYLLFAALAVICTLAQYFVGFISAPLLLYNKDEYSFNLLNTQYWLPIGTLVCLGLVIVCSLLFILSLIFNCCFKCVKNEDSKGNRGLFFACGGETLFAFLFVFIVLALHAYYFYFAADYNLLFFY